IWKEFLPRSIPMSAMFSMIVLRMKACPQHSTGKEGVTISLNIRPVRNDKILPGFSTYQLA
ncbi:hypothetical protein DN594_00835, partial [Enterobacter cloacae]